MKDGFMETQNKAVWREMIPLEDNATPLITGEVDDISRKKAFELHLENFREGLLKTYSEEQVRKAMKKFYAKFDYLERNGFFQVEMSLIGGIDWKQKGGTIANKTNVHVKVLKVDNALKDAEFKGIEEITFVLPKTCSHYKVESAVWDSVKKRFPSYEYEKFLNSSVAELFVSGNRRAYEWVCCVW